MLRSSVIVTLVDRASARTDIWVPMCRLLIDQRSFHDRRSRKTDIYLKRRALAVCSCQCLNLFHSIRRCVSVEEHNPHFIVFLSN